jgi:DHA1 family bicyclomycin/chloramphenicol resistance-like MFS transporter
MLGAWMSTAFGWRALFHFLAVFALLCFVGMHFTLAESHDIRHQPPLDLGRVFRTYGELLRDRPFLGYAASSGLAMAGMFAYIAGSPFVLIDLGHVPAAHFAWIFGSNALGFIAASQVNALLLKRHAPTAILRHALWLPAAAGAGLCFLSGTGVFSLALFLLGFFVYVASLGLIVPNASAAALATHGQRAGAASALLGSLLFALATLAGVGVSQMHDGTAWPLALVLALCGCGAWTIHRAMVHRPAVAS